jgi:hypothetical protein
MRELHDEIQDELKLMERGNVWSLVTEKYPSIGTVRQEKSERTYFKTGNLKDFIL